MYRSMMLPMFFDFALLFLAAANIAQAQSPTPPAKSPPAALLAAPALTLNQPVTTGPTLVQPATPAPTVLLATPKAPRTIRWGPTPVGHSLAWAGRQLEKLDRQHVWTIGHTVYAPVSPAPAASVVVAQAAPQPAPAQFLMIQAPAPQPAPAIQYQVVPVPMSLPAQPDVARLFRAEPPPAPSPQAPAQLRFDAVPAAPVVPSAQR